MNVFADMSQLVSMLKRLRSLQKATKAIKAIKGTKATKATDVHKSTEASTSNIVTFSFRFLQMGFSFELATGLFCFGHVISYRQSINHI